MNTIKSWLILLSALFLIAVAISFDTVARIASFFANWINDFLEPLGRNYYKVILNAKKKKTI